jgi:hypothetical protein
MKIKYIIILFIIIIVYIILYCLLKKDYIIDDKEYDLKKDGCCVIKNILDKDEIEHLKIYCENNQYKEIKEFLLKNENLKNMIHTILNKDYIFQDYIWIIKKSLVHTCHRDNNGDFFNKDQEYPSYTILIYLEDMERCLGVIPTSHNNINSYNINFSINVENILCKKGDAILFNANLIHVGSINKKDDNLRIQLKITHINDINKLLYYQNFNKILNQSNNLPKELIKLQRNLSCMFPYISNLTQTENIKSSRGSDNGAQIGILQKIYSYFFYGNAKFYDLPNAFERFKQSLF